MESLAVTRKDYSAKIWSSMVEICSESRKLVFATLFLCIAFGCYITIVKQSLPPKEWQVFLLTFVDIYDHPHPDIEEKLVNHQHPDIEEKLVNHQHKPSTSYRFNKGTQFSLFHRFQGRFGQQKWYLSGRRQQSGGMVDVVQTGNFGMLRRQGQTGEIKGTSTCEYCTSDSERSS